MSNKKLINKKYGSKFKEHLIEQYKLYIESAEEVSRKRQLSNNFYLSLNTALLTISGYLSFSIKPLLILILSILGFFICDVWIKTLKSYRQLNSAKYKVIHDLEKELPANIFDFEWTKLGRGKSKDYNKLTKVEKKVPRIFQIFFIIIFIFSLTI